MLRSQHLFIDCLNPERWPPDIATEITYGDDEVRSLCRRFSLPEMSTVEGFRQYKDEGGKILPDDLRKLRDALNTLVVSAADCERAFSSMNIILTACRYSLSVDTLASLMFIAICGPPIELFKPDSYVSYWLQNHVSADDTKARARSADDSQSERGLQNVWRLM